MTHVEYTVPSSDGRTALCCHGWVPDGEASAVMVVVHGMCEHASRYSEFGEYMASNGVAVYANDLLGHGATSPEDRGFFAEKDGDDLLVEDVGRMLDDASSKNPGVPRFVLGHSMGSFVARRFMAEHGDAIDGLIAVGTGQQSPGSVKMGLSMARMLCKTKGVRARSGFLDNAVLGSNDKPFKDSGIRNAWLNSDPEAVQRYNDDPDCGFGFTVAGYRDMLSMIARLEAKESFGNIPKDLRMLFISGGDDPVGDFGKGVERAVEDLRQAGLQPDMNIYEGMRHEILNERNRAMVFDDILEWISKAPRS